MQESSLFTTPFPAFIVSRFLDNGHSDWCVVMPLCYLDLWFWAIFRVPFFFCKDWVNFTSWNCFLQCLSCFELFCRFLTVGYFLSAVVIYSPAIFVNIKWPLSTGFKAAVAGNSHKAAGFLHSQLCLLGQQSLPGSRVPRLSIRVECARTNPQKLMSHCFSFVFLI